MSATEEPRLYQVFVRVSDSLTALVDEVHHELRGIASACNDPGRLEPSALPPAVPDQCQ